MTTLRIIPLGGLGEIGRNMMLYEWGDTAIAIDVGLMFPEEEMLGVDLVIPDITYLAERPDLLQAIFLTHGHEDHIGALPFLLREINVPVYCTRLTKGLVDVKLREQRLDGEANISVMEAGQSIEIGPFRVEFFSVAHSIPDAAGLIVHTPLGRIVHTGDFKIDHTPINDQHTDLTRLAEIGREGALLLAADSTYVEIEGYTPSERTVGAELDHAIGEAPGRVIVTTFASLISRVQMVIEAARKHNRRIFVTGRSMVNNVQMAQELGYLTAPPGIFLSVQEMRTYPDERTVVICTGSQGEPTSALTRMASGSHPHITLHATDTVILSSNPIPGNETLVYRNIDNIYRVGARVLYNRIAPVHVRGHAAREELKIIHRIVRPRYFMGIHGEYRHLVLHRALAIELGMPPERAFVLTDGDVLEIDSEGAQLGERVPAEYVYVDGLGIGDVDSIVLRDRAHLASEGMVVVVTAIHHQTNRPSAPPDVFMHGFVGPDEEEAVVQRVRETVDRIVSAEGQHIDWTTLREALKDEVQRALYEMTHRRPLVLPVTVEV